MPSLLSRKKRFLAVSLFWAVLITLSAVQPHDFVWKFLPSEALQSAAHVVAYGLLGYWVCLWLIFARSFFFIRMTDLRVSAASFVICMAWGAFNEFLQLFCPTRYADLHDVGFNGIGVFSGIAFFLWRSNHLRLRKGVHLPRIG